MAQFNLIFPDIEFVPPFFLGLQAQDWQNVFFGDTFDWYIYNDCSKAAWNVYAVALMNGMAFDLALLKILMVSYDYNESEQEHLHVLTWLARNILISDNYADFFLCTLPDYSQYPDMSTEVLVDCVDSFIKIGMRLTAEQIYRITPHCFEAKSVFLRRMYQVRIIDPTEADVGLLLQHISGKFEEDFLRVVLYDRQYNLPQLLVYAHGSSFFENFLPQLYHDGVFPVNPYDFRHYNKEPTLRMKLAMLCNNVDHAIDDLQFTDSKLKLQFKRMKQRAIALCDHIPVELAYKAAETSGIKCLSGPRMLALMKKRQLESVAVTIVE